MTHRLYNLRLAYFNITMTGDKSNLNCFRFCIHWIDSHTVECQFSNWYFVNIDAIHLRFNMVKQHAFSHPKLFSTDQIHKQEIVSRFFEPKIQKVLAENNLKSVHSICPVIWQKCPFFSVTTASCPLDNFLLSVVHGLDDKLSLIIQKVGLYSRKNEYLANWDPNLNRSCEK